MTPPTDPTARERLAQERVTHALRAARLTRIAAADDLRARAVRRSRWVRRALVVAALVAVVLIIVAGTLAVLDHRATERTDLDGEVLEAARSATTSMLTSDPAHAEAYVERVLALSTGTQKKRLEQAGAALSAAVAAQTAPSAGRVLSAGLVTDPGSDDPGSHAEVLVVVQASNPVLLGGDPQADRLTLTVGMTRTDAGWLVDSAVPA
ncbi:hypothetical protein J8M97_04825 [Gordonia polyisoprenivorans]|uniref:hypothetical protein n=1 Tax=Gordonia polyisoprenivorans TaxID=84595 RepID=UPI001B8C2E29|nr:hypothetical protein [Gordonia polyisoprenivorans]QUD83971.1 hypothetical protein J8M97_04825 [Gordonia polyisoprenivorans]